MRVQLPYDLILSQNPLFDWVLKAKTLVPLSPQYRCESEEPCVFVTVSDLFNS